jgi:hypothetical protein
MNEFIPWMQRNWNLPKPPESGPARLAATWHRLVLWLREPISTRGLAPKRKRGNLLNRSLGKLRHQVSKRSRKSEKNPRPPSESDKDPFSPVYSRRWR